MHMLKGLWDLIFEDPRSGLIDTRQPQFQAEFAVDVPDKLALGKLYLVGESGHYWCAAMHCPCGCGEAIQLSLVKNDEPSWRFRLDRQKRPSLFPSVWRTVGCRSHFILRQGDIIWCNTHFQMPARSSRRT